MAFIDSLTCVAPSQCTQFRIKLKEFCYLIDTVAKLSNQLIPTFLLLTELIIFFPFFQPKRYLDTLKLAFGNSEGVENRQNVLCFWSWIPLVCFLKFVQPTRQARNFQREREPKLQRGIFEMTTHTWNSTSNTHCFQIRFWFQERQQEKKFW